jgi:hypothetical protein
MRTIEHRTTAFRAFLALVAGMVVAAVLVVALVAVEAAGAEASGKHLLFPVGLQVSFALPMAAGFALPIGLSSIPVWLGIGRLGLNGWRSAAVSGFCMTLVIWLAYNLLDGSMSVMAVLGSGLQWAAVGAVAGMATWRMAYRVALSHSALTIAEFD